MYKYTYIHLNQLVYRGFKREKRDNTDVVFDSVKMAFKDEDSILDHKYGKQMGSDNMYIVQMYISYVNFVYYHTKFIPFSVKPPV